MVGTAAWLGCDWGTTSLRVYALDAAGEVHARRDSALGLLAAREMGFAQALRATAGDLLVPGLPVLLAGMVGARGGWVEAPYLAVPAGLDELAGALCAVPGAGRPMWVVPGLRDAGGTQPEVMRGEETQVMGALAAGCGAGTYVLPGTHSKWVTVAAGRVTAFATYVTGDLFAALCDHTVLGDLPPRDRSLWDWDGDAFPQGVARGARLASGGALLNALFSARTLGLAGQVPVAGLGPYLSGLLIGAEIGGARQHGAPDTAVLVGGGEAVTRYQAAGQVLGMRFTAAPADVAARGLAALAARRPLE